MLISKKWLQEFVQIPKHLSDAELAEKISRSTVEVEQMIDQTASFKNIVVGVITSVLPHPNADRLSVCQVDVGDRVVQIVCGGTNVAEGMKVAVSLPGSYVRWHGQGELIEIKETKLRGEKSEGMICASGEIGLPQTEADDEIRDLDELDAKAGTPLSTALGLDDVIFEIEHKSLTNRPDLMGHYGMAREVAALTKTELAEPILSDIAVGTGVKIEVKIEEPKLCPRYMAVAMDGVQVSESPQWITRRLEACGIRSINNVVDVTNFVMLELGQPMHAFDADILGERIVVRKAKAKEKIVALDEKTYTLDSDTLLITNGRKPVAIAGVMGAQGSGVSETTTRIVFESANFDPVSVRRTSSKLGLRSDSSVRFEKSLDPELCESALRRAVELMKELCPSARVASDVVDIYTGRPEPTHLELTPELVNARLGTNIPVSDMKDILTHLGFIFTSSFTVIVPSWRATKDVQIVEDVIEEIARIWGYDNMTSTLPTFPINPPLVDPVRQCARSIRRTLTFGLGVTETYRYAFAAPEVLHVLGFAHDLKLANPLAQDRPYLVQSLIPNLFDTVAINHRTVPVVSVFEIERVFLGSVKGEEDGEGGVLPAQPYHIGIAYHAHGDDVPFVELQRQVRIALSREGFEVSFQKKKQPASWMHPVRAADILVNGTTCGLLAEALPNIAKQLGIEGRVAVAEMDLSLLTSLEKMTKIFTPIPQFPSAKRDLAFVVEERVEYASIVALLKKASALLESVELFDVYRGGGVEAGKKSLALHLAFRCDERTLESKEIDDQMEKILDVLVKEFGAIMRS